MDYKYRVDFYYWNCESGFSHIETIENTNKKELKDKMKSRRKNRREKRRKKRKSNE